MNCCRYPVDVKAVGLMQCRKQKYMMAVSWSDRNNLLIYRTFEEFKKFHKVLKRKFPIEGGLLKKSDRSIPNQSLGQSSADAKLMQRSRNLSRSMERLKLLETYSQELLKADAKVSQSEDVIQFFKAQTQDLDPSFPKNSLSPGFRTNQCQTLLSSIIIMPSEMGDGKKDQFKQQNTSVTQPVVSQNYSCIEAYETKDTKNRPFKVAKKEIVEVLIKDVTGWWLVENKDQQIAWFPAPYLEALSYLQSRNDPFLFLPGTLYYTVRAYKSQKADELSLNVGVVVEVLEKSDNVQPLLKAGPTPTLSPLALVSPILSSLLVFPLPSMAAPPPSSVPVSQVWRMWLVLSTPWLHFPGMGVSVETLISPAWSEHA
uniref:NADPH oxidase organizer 1 n=1 Tax=Gopherus evgoodei TaxID=1825980 RepID=A0A8C4W7R6_9SAUR